MSNAMSLLIGVTVGLIVVSGVAYLWYLPIKISRERRHRKEDAIFVLSLVSIVIWPLWIVAIVWSVSEDNRISRALTYPSPRPVIHDEVETWSRNRDEPGTYRIDGIDVTTRSPKTVTLWADGRTGAKMAAEEMGLIFTDRDVQFIA